MTLTQIIILALIQGAAELLPVSSSAHVILAQKLMGIDPSSPHMTFLLVMLHTGTMFAVLFYFWKRWQNLLSKDFIRAIVLSTGVTGVLGFGLKLAIEKALTALQVVEGKAEIEMLFKNLPLISVALFSAGALILYSSRHEKRATESQITSKRAISIGLIQGLCLPFRGFSRSGATISTAMITGLDRKLAEDFSFALAVVLTPPVILLQLHRLHKATGSIDIQQLAPGFMGMVFAFISGMLALRWLSSWLEKGKWHYFGFYCWGVSALCALLAFLGY
jgi:undecaprenyl-diphosphatase